MLQVGYIALMESAVKKANRRAYYLANKERENARRRERYANEPEKRAREGAQNAAWRKRNDGYWRVRRYGIVGVIRSEPELCELCGKKPTRRMCMDHDHITGKFRGWLCVPCNRALGQLGDSVERIAHALKYLQNAELL